jgi:TatD DNase family protein
MSLIDAHCHLTYEQFADVDAVINRSIASGVTGWVAIGTDIEESKKTIELAAKFPNMFASVAIHPHHAKLTDDAAISEIKKIAQNKKVVAIGETGLDFHYEFSTRQQQRDSFIRHLELAAQLRLPVVVHSREAFDETVKILDEHLSKSNKLVFHCFSGSLEEAKVVLEKGWFISLTGVVTFKNAEMTREVAKFVPLERLMIETDAPYLSPEPMRKQKVNEPALLIHTARFIAELKRMDLADFAKAVCATTNRFFTLGLDF